MKTESPIKMIINFKEITGPVYTGRARGEELRKAYHLDEMDLEEGVVQVEIPENTYTISSSFFLGMFGPSVIKAGDKKRFFERFHFSKPDFLDSAINDYVSMALQSRNLFSN